MLRAAIPSTERTMSPAAFRAAYFSQLADQCYLGTCSLAPHSSVLDTAMHAMLGVMRGHAIAWPAFESEVHQLRERIAQLIGAHADQIALMPNASVGAYQVASTLAWQDRARLLHSNQEFPSIAHVWLAQAARGARPQAIDCAGLADDIVARYEQAIGRDTKLSRALKQFRESSKDDTMRQTPVVSARREQT